MKKYIIGSAITAIALAFAALASAQTFTFSNNMTVGSRGQDVANLQSFLISAGFHIPSVESGFAQYGYFGIQTRSAVAAYQAANGIPPTGFVGPLTRGRMNGGSNNNSSALRVASPNGGETWTDGTTQYITWDGAPGILRNTASVQLVPAVPACAEPTANPRCMIMVRAPYQLANVNLSSRSFAWIVGTTQDGSPIPDGQYKIQICPMTPGAIGLSTGCDSSDNYFTVTSKVNWPPDPQAPVINGIDSPTTLSVGQTGTWSVHATDPQNSQLSVSVDWGDRVACPSGYSCSQPDVAPAGYFAQKTTFTHVYASQGGYTITFTVKNSAGLSAISTTDVQVTGSTTAGPLNLTSPRGGETWVKGTNQTITWTSPYYFQAAYADIKLNAYRAPCTGICPMYAIAPYIIATGVSINQNSYSWNVGNVTPLDATGYGIATNVTTVPDGQYTISICQTNSSNCATSSAPFSISSNTQTSGLPDINILFPNGGETWTANTTQSASVNITGDYSKIAGGFLSFYLVDSSNQQILLMNDMQDVSLGTKTINIPIPATITPGMYRLLVYMYSAGGVSCMSLGCPPPPTSQMQAYDYSDNYINVVQGYGSYPWTTPYI